MSLVVGYLTKRFPRLSETFILDEILALQAAGVDLRLFALADPREAIIQPDVAAVRGPVRYLHAGRGPLRATSEVPATLLAHGRLAARSPRRYLGVVGYLLRRRRHVSSVRHFLEAGRLACWLEADGVTHLHAAFAHGPASVAHFVHLLTGLPFSFSAHAKDLYRSPADLLAVKVGAARFVLVCSAAAASDLRRIAGPAADKVVLAYHGVDTRRFQPTVARVDLDSCEPLRVLAVGRLVAKKGYPVLLDAVACALAGGTRLHCRILGTGDQRGALEAAIHRFGLGDTVTLLGGGTQEDVVEQLGWAQVFVQASVVLADGDRDGIPNALLEAMAAGLAVVATPVGGIAEVITSGDTGLLVPPGDSAVLAAALAGLAADAGRRRRLGEAGRRQVIARFDRAVCARAIVRRFDPRTDRADRSSGVAV